MKQIKWVLTEINKDLKKETGLDDLTLSILSNRGYKTKKDIENLMNLNINSLYNPKIMKDSLKAVKVIAQSISNNEKIIIYGDYDCDGAMGIVTGYLALKNLGASVEYYSNNRFKEGYQVSPEGVKNILKINPDTRLIITVDNGISGHDMVDFCKKNNIKVVITDHHLPGRTLPKAEAVVNPKRKDCLYPFKELCGAGVIWKLMYLLYDELNRDLDYIYNLLDIVALATVADMVPLVEENRIIVKEGLKLMRKEKRKIFKILREETYTAKGDIDSHNTIGFTYGPMINAEGRLDGKPDKAVKMFLEEDEGDIRKYVRYLININEERKKITRKQVKIAKSLIDSKGRLPYVILLKGYFHEGIVGLIAGRIKEEYHRPAIVLTQVDSGVWKGSTRSIEAFHMKNSLDKVSKYLLSYGGHSQAAGLSIDGKNIFKFEKAINNFAKTILTEDDLVPKVFIDYVVDSKISYDMIKVINALEPYGKDFEYPIIAIKNCHIIKPSYIGQGQKYAKLHSYDYQIVMWNEEDVEMYKIDEPRKLRLAGSPEINIYNGKTNLQFRVIDNNWFAI